MNSEEARWYYNQAKAQCDIEISAKNQYEYRIYELQTGMRPKLDQINALQVQIRHASAAMG